MSEASNFNNRQSAQLVMAAGFFVFRRNEDAARRIEFLLLLTPGNLWSPPKGHLDHGESALDAAYRELHEESGLKKEEVKVDETYTVELKYNNQYGRPKTVTYWLAELSDKNTEVHISHEHIAYKWFTLEEAIAVAQFDNLKDGLREVFKKVQALTA